MENEYSLSGNHQFEVKTPPPPRNGYRQGVPLMEEFVRTLDEAEGIWFLFYTYKTKQSGYQRASDAKKKYGYPYEFVARHDENGTSVYGRKMPLF